MRYWYDTEFYEDGRTIDPISFGIVAEDGRKLYFEWASFDWTRVPMDHWLWDNVYPHLELTQETLLNETQIAHTVRRFITKNGTEMNNELWGYYPSYDHVVLAQIFGRMVNMPPGIPWFTRDVKQELERLRVFGGQDLPLQTTVAHNALADAEWTKTAWEFLRDTEYKSWGVM